MSAALARLARTPLVRLVLVGASTTALYLALARLGHDELGLPAALASLGAYAIAAVASYLAHRGFTFRSPRPHREAAWRFGAVSLAGYAVALGAPLALELGSSAPPSAGFLVVCLVAPALNAVALSRIVFRRRLAAPLPR